MATCEREYDNIPSEFEGLNFDAVPELCRLPESTTAQEPTTAQESTTAQEPTTAQPTTAQPTTAQPTTAQESTTSRCPEPGLETSNPTLSTVSSPGSNSFTFDEIDDSFLLACDDLERKATVKVSGRQTAALKGSNSPHSTKLESSASQEPVYPNQPSSSHSIPKKRKASPSCPEPRPIKKKRGAENEGQFDQVLEEYADELTCPICCDLFVAAHVGNPCGHTFCGECGFNWIKNKMQITCPSCRTQLIQPSPFIRNIAMDNTVEKHVRALASSGKSEWKPGGSCFEDWGRRKEEWKAYSARRLSETSNQISWPNVQQFYSSLGANAID